MIVRDLFLQTKHTDMQCNLVKAPEWLEVKVELTSLLTRGAIVRLFKGGRTIASQTLFQRKFLLLNFLCILLIFLKNMQKTFISPRTG